MEGNKDEARRCLVLAEEALACGDKHKALRFMRIAQRLNPNIDVKNFVQSYERSNSGRHVEFAEPKVKSESTNGNQCYTEEHVKLIKEIRKNKDYYAVLGVARSCSIEEIRRAYKRLSLKVHPDKNKAPGAEEAFKKVGKAFKCLSDEESRTRYDQTGLTEDYDLNPRENQFRRRRRRAPSDDFFDPDDIFNSFFYGSSGDVFHRQRVYRERAREPTRHQQVNGGFGLLAFIQVIPIFIMLIIVCLPFSASHYSLQKTHTYRFPKVTEKHGVEYFVKSLDFDQRFPEGSHARVNLEYSILRDYKGVLGRYCHMELQRRQWSKDYPTPHCNKLRSLGVA